MSLHTLRANIEYGFFEARTTFGRIGVKVWIYKGEGPIPREVASEPSGPGRRRDRGERSERPRARRSGAAGTTPGGTDAGRAAARERAAASETTPAATAAAPAEAPAGTEEG